MQPDRNPQQVCKSTRFRLLAVLLVCIAAGLGVWIVVHRLWLDNQPAEPILVSPETTVFTSPRLRDGTVDYATALNLEYNQARDSRENLLAGIVEILGPAGIAEHYGDSPAPQGYWEALGVDPQTPGTGWIPLEAYVSSLRVEELPEVYRRAAQSHARRAGRIEEGVPVIHDGEESVSLPPADPARLAQRRWDRAISTPWTPQDFPLISRWLDANQKTFHAFARIAGRRHYFNPLTPPPGESFMQGTYLGPVLLLRDLARGFVASIQREIGLGNLDRAMHQAVEMLNLARTLENSMTLTERSLAAFVERQAIRALGQIALAPSIGAERLQKIARLLEDLPEPASMDRIVRNEALLAIETVQLICRSKSTNCPGPSIDGNRILRSLVRDMEAHQAILAETDPHERRALQALRDLAFDKRRSELNRLQSFLGAWWAKPLVILAPSSTRRRWQTKLIGLSLGMLGWTSYQDSADLFQQTRTQFRMLRVAVEIRLFQARHERWPRDLQELDQLSQDRIRDPFAGGLFTYQTSQDGFVIYSWGPDLKDDGATEADDVLQYPPQSHSTQSE